MKTISFIDVNITYPSLCSNACVCDDDVYVCVYDVGEISNSQFGAYVCVSFRSPICATSLFVSFFVFDALFQPNRKTKLIFKKQYINYGYNLDIRSKYKIDVGKVRVKRNNAIL